MKYWIDKIEKFRPEAVRQATRHQLFGELQATETDIDYKLIERTANLLELLVHDLLFENLADDYEKAKTLRQASADAFRLLRILPRPDTGFKDGYFLLRTSALAVLGDMEGSATRWLRTIDWPNLPLDSSDWRERTWATVLDIWLRLICKNGWADQDTVLEKIDLLRSSQIEYEDRYLKDSENEYSPAAALELIGLYHLIGAAEIFVAFTKNGNVDGNFQVRQLLEVQFDRVISVCKHAQLIELELMSRLLSACACQMTENSVWTVTRAANFRVNQFVHSLMAENREDQPIFELLPPQRRTLVEQGLLGSGRRSIVVSLPTSSGKTLIAEFRILHAINQFEQERGWVAYLTPTHTLVNQISRRLRRDLEPLNIIVEQMSPALEFDSVESKLLCQKNPENEFRVLVTTPEKLDLMLRQGWEKRINRPLTLVVVDEAHNIQNKERGLRLELLLATINRECKYAHFLLLTPFIENAREVARWLGGESSDEISLEVDGQLNDRVIGIVHPERGEPINKDTCNYSLSMKTIRTNRQTLEVEDFLKFPKIEEIAKSYSKASSQTNTAAIVAQHLQTRGPVIVMHGRPDWVWNLAEILKLEVNRDEESKKIRLVQDFLKLEFGENYPLIDLLSYRIGIYHSGLSDEVRSLMEWLTENSELRILVATTTIAQELNFPVSGVVMASNQYPYGEDVSSEDFWNIAGHTGRMSQEQLGVIALVAKDESKVQELSNFVNNQTKELNSTLLQLVDGVIDQLDDLGQLVYRYPQWSSFVQYLVYTYNQMGKPSNFADEIEQVMRNTFGYEKLRRRNSKLASRLLSSIRTYSEYIQQPEQPVALVDSTGFSLESINRILYQAGQEGITAQSWKPNSLFHKDNDALQKMMGVLLNVPELRENLKAVKGNSATDGDQVALIVKDWVNGDSVCEIARKHFMDRGDEMTAMTACGRNLYGSLANTVAWGLGALLSVTVHDLEEDDFQSLRNLPSYVYYGVNNEQAIALRLLGVSRTAANKLANSLGDVLQEPITNIRNHLKEMDTQCWQEALGKQEGAIYREVWRVMERLE